MTPRQFVLLRSFILKRIAASYGRIEELRAKVDNTLPPNLRPATSSDIKAGAIIWYKDGDEGPFWKIVEEVLHPNDLFKAYTADDGSSYGLDDAWVQL